jgi:hypothetical protein
MTPTIEARRVYALAVRHNLTFEEAWRKLLGPLRPPVVLLDRKSKPTHAAPPKKA